MRVLITGAQGFIGKNLTVRLREHAEFEVEPFTRTSDTQRLAALAADVDAVVHLAGVNRPADQAEFTTQNAGLTVQLCDALQSAGRRIPVIFSSSIQAELDNPYGRSKRQAEESLRAYARATGSHVHLFRLPNVFGKWSKPDYNSVVATFCHNVARGALVQVNDSSAPLTLVYVEDVVDEFIRVLRSGEAPASFSAVPVQYVTTVGEVATLIRSFRESRTSLLIDRVGIGLIRALYSTYVSFLPPEAFSYRVPAYSDARGTFVEMLKTADTGQISFFTALPGVTRGRHYHHSKTEKFLVIRGKARFRFRHLQTGEHHEVFTSGEVPEIVETVPGWVHEITNVGTEELIVMLWANENFDRARPDTVASEVWT